MDMIINDEYRRQFYGRAASHETAPIYSQSI